MPTQNRRVATYLPPELDDRFKAFITERNLASESQALIVVLSEFLGVGLPVAQKVDYSGFVKAEQFNELLAKVNELSTAIGSRSPGVVLRDLLSRVEALEKAERQLASLTGGTNETHTGNPNALAETTASPGQMDLLDIAESNSPSSSKSEPPQVKQGSSRYALLRELVSNSADKPQIAKDSDTLSNLPSELQPLTAPQLSQRFGLNKKVVTNNKNNWKSDPQKFINWSKSKDPQGIAWQHDPEKNLYYPLGATDSAQVNPLPEGSERSGEG